MEKQGFWGGFDGIVPFLRGLKGDFGINGFYTRNVITEHIKISVCVQSCVRQEAGYCSIGWKADTADTKTFDVNIGLRDH